MKGARHVREKKEKHVGRMVGRIFAVIGLYLGSAIALLLGAITVVCLGPSVQARDLFVNTVMETSAAKFLAYMYFSEEEIAAIRAKTGWWIPARSPHRIPALYRPWRRHLPMPLKSRM